MLQQSEGKIFLAGERGHTETEWFRSYNTFNFGTCKSESKAPVGPLYVLNDDTLAGGKSFKLLVEEDSDVILLPSVGAISYTDSTGKESLIQVGEVQISSLKKGTTIDIANPYENELVNFIQLWIKNPVVNSISQNISFNIERNINSLINLSLKSHNQPLQKISIGKFMGREEIIYKPSSKNGFFVFVLQGAFEVQYRLLEARDGLALWNTEEIEIEALSNEAILLTIEMKMDNEIKESNEINVSQINFFS